MCFDSAPCLTMMICPGGEDLIAERPHDGGRLCALWYLAHYWLDLCAFEFQTRPMRLRLATLFAMVVELTVDTTTETNWRGG
jgi:hypothetical protein